MEGSIVAHKTLHYISENHVPSFVIKIDMMKAYDRVKWFFLIKVLRNLVLVMFGVNGLKLVSWEITFQY